MLPAADNKVMRSIPGLLLLLLLISVVLLLLVVVVLLVPTVDTVEVEGNNST